MVINYRRLTTRCEYHVENLSGQRAITTEADGASSVYAADVDGDGDLDVLSASFHGDAIAWYENHLGEPRALIAALDGLAVSAGFYRLEVSWLPTPVTDTGGSPVLRYAMTAAPDDGGAQAACAAEAPETCMIVGVRLGVNYSVSV